MDVAVGTPTFWATEDLPPQPTLGRDLAADVLVIGGGLTGLTTAYLLSRAGVRVALLERDRLGAGDSGHTTAHLTAVTDRRPHELVKRLGRRQAAALWGANLTALAQIQTIVEELSISAGFARLPGYLHLPFDGDGDREDRQTLMTDAELARRWGVDAVFEPSVPLMQQPGVRFPAQAVVHPTNYIRGLIDALRDEGAAVFEHSEPTFGEQADQLTCNGHRVTAGWTVIATHNPLQGRQNMAAAALIQTEMAAYTSYALHASVPGQPLPAGLFWDTNDPYRYVRIEETGNGCSVVAGGEDHKTGQVEDTRAPHAALEKWCRRLFPEATITHRWSGQVLETTDGMPIIGEVVPRQWIATGFGGNGITFGTLAAMLVRNAVTGRANPWSKLVSPRRIAAMRDPWEYLRENVDYPYYMLKRLLGPEQDRSLRSLKPGDGTVVTLDGRPVAASRDKEGLYRLRSAVCPHMGCLVAWNRAERTWDCPCHGSRFMGDGKVVRGPAERDLDPVTQHKREASE